MRKLISDFAIILTILLFCGVDAFVGVNTPKLIVPSEFKVHMIRICVCVKLCISFFNTKTCYFMVFETATPRSFYLRDNDQPGAASSDYTDNDPCFRQKARICLIMLPLSILK